MCLCIYDLDQELNNVKYHYLLLLLSFIFFFEELFLFYYNKYKLLKTMIPS